MEGLVGLSINFGVWRLGSKFSDSAMGGTLHFYEKIAVPLPVLSIPCRMHVR